MNEDKVILKILEIEADVKEMKENMATKADLHQITNTLDVLVKLANKKDQELTFMGSRIKRVEDDVKLIKPLVGLSAT